MIETRVNELLSDGSKIFPNPDQTIAGGVPDKVFACVGGLVAIYYESTNGESALKD
jgi:hypothetical protein